MDVHFTAKNKLNIMKYTKEKIEKELRDLLEDCLSMYKQDGALISLEYDEKTEICTIKMNTFINDEDDYIGFESY